MPRKRTVKGPYETFGRRLEQARKDLGWTRNRAAVYVEDTGLVESLSHETLRRMEVGFVAASDVPTIRILAMAKAYGVPVSHLSPIHAQQLGVVNSAVTELVHAELSAVPNPDPDDPDDGELAPVPSSSGNFGGPDGASRGNCWTGELTPVDQLAA